MRKASLALTEEATAAAQRATAWAVATGSATGNEHPAAAGAGSHREGTTVSVAQVARGSTGQGHGTVAKGARPTEQ